MARKLGFFFGGLGAFMLCWLGCLGLVFMYRIRMCWYIDIPFFTVIGTITLTFFVVAWGCFFKAVTAPLRKKETNK